jgi:hypothetical protein
MRAKTKGKHENRKRFAIVIGVAAAGAMALGAQTVLAGGDRAPDLKLSGHQTQGPLPPKETGQRPGPPGPRAVAVSASCGEFIGPPASPTDLTPAEASELGESPPANLPDLGCHLSAEGKVTTVKNGTLRPSKQAQGVDVPGPGLQCSAVNHDPSVLRCHWFSGMRVGMVLKLGKKTLKQVRSALDDGQKVLAEVTARAKFDASGKVETATRTIRLVKYLK